VDGEKQVEGASLYWGPVMLGIKSPQKPGKRYTLVVPSIQSASEIGKLPAAALMGTEKTAFSIPNAHLKVLVSKDGFPPPSQKKLEPSNVKTLSLSTLVSLSELFTGQVLGIFDVRSPADGSVIGLVSRRLEEGE
jgi:hypothetical protein